MIRINDCFFTVQGEAYNMGRRALFIRMPRCNLKCDFCDTEFETSNPWSEDDLRDFAKTEKTRFAVLTGGEPLLNKQSPQVINILRTLGYEIAVETNGTMPYLRYISWVTCSPKRDAGYKIHRDLRFKVDEYKYVVDKDFDFSVLDKHHSGGTHYSDLTRLWLSPEYGDFKQNVSKIIEYIKKNPEWRISLQTHKTMEIA